VPIEVINPKASWQILIGALCSGAALTVSSSHAYGQTMVKVDGIGLVPAKIVMACEQATGDGGHEAFFDADWDYFSDCVNDELHRKRRK
jgi:hypothetical protein